MLSLGMLSLGMLGPTDVGSSSAPSAVLHSVRTRRRAAPLFDMRTAEPRRTPGEGPNAASGVGRERRGGRRSGGDDEPTPRANANAAVRPPPRPPS